MRNDGLTKVNFHDRQVLRPRDFVAEQLYHLIGHRRHNISGHSWGIVEGLWLTVEEGNVQVEPGTAVDGYGRDLIVGQRLPLRTETFAERLTDALDVWLHYGQEGAAGAVPSQTCLEPDDANGRNGAERPPIPPYRWREHPIVVLTNASVSDPRASPDGVPDVDRPFPPQRAFPVDDEPWGVYLGTIRRDPASGTITASDDNRPYVGLVGWQVRHPADAGRIELGPGTSATPDRRFAVFIAENGAPNPPPAPIVTIDQEEGASPPTIAVHGLGAVEHELTITTDEAGTTYTLTLTVRDGNEEPRLEIGQVKVEIEEVTTTTLTVRGTTVVEGNVAVTNGSVGFEGGPAYTGAERPWNLYRCGGRDPDSGDGTDELRLEMGAGQPRGRNRVAVGKWDAAKKAFEPCLTVTDECLVTVHGNLIVNGSITPPRRQGRVFRQVQRAVTAREDVPEEEVSRQEFIDAAYILKASDSASSPLRFAENLERYSMEAVRRLIKTLEQVRDRPRVPDVT